MEPEPQPLGDDGIWCELVRPPDAAGSKLAALFLDRDGVLVEEVGYLHRPEDVRLMPGAAEVIAAANRAGVPVVVVTNQSGIGRGYYGWDAFRATEARIRAELAAHDATPNLVLACPYHPDGVAPYRYADHPDRKPAPGMLRRAAARLGLDLAASWIVGDRAGDLAAGRAAGLAGGIHVATGHGIDAAEQTTARSLATAGFRVHLVPSLAAAAGLLPILQPSGD